MERLIGWSELDLGGDAREREGCVVLVMERVESGGRGRLGSSFAGSAGTACVLGPVKGSEKKRTFPYLVHPG